MTVDRGSLAGWRVLVPAARAGSRGVLASLLERAGAEAVQFPRLVALAPRAGELERAAEAITDAAWLLVAGGDSVEHLLQRLPEAARAQLGGRVRLAAVGSSAVQALRRRGLEPAWAPRFHTADAVAGGMDLRAGETIVLVRESRASDELPRALIGRGARVVAVHGYRTRLRGGAAEARAAFARPFDLLALANPSAARVLQRAAEELPLVLERCLAGVTVAAVGASTARAAARAGFAPDLVAGGRLAHLMEGLRELVVTNP